MGADIIVADNAICSPQCPSEVEQGIGIPAEVKTEVVYVTKYTPYSFLMLML